MTAAAQIPEGSVVITPMAMYVEMQATHQAVRDVAGKLDGVLSDHGRRLDGHDNITTDHEMRLRVMELQAAQSTDHEQRLSAVEKRVWMAVGASVLFSGVATAAATLLAGAGR